MQQKSTKKYFDFHAPVFYPSAGLIILFIALTLVYVRQANSFFSEFQTIISEYTGWFFIILVNFFLFFALYLAFGKYKDIRLGKPNETPEFSNWSWFSMLFSAGMGIGLLFWGVAEPLQHYHNVPLKTINGDINQAKMAMAFTFLHWGFHTWAIYVVVGLTLAFFTFNRGYPLTLRYAFYPLLGEKVKGFWGNLIDVVAVIATLFGLATSLGFGVQQVNAGLNYLFNLPYNTNIQVLLIAGITGIATLSVVAGLDKGVRRLSEFNIWLGMIFLTFMIIAGPTIFILDSFIENIGFYLQNILRIGFWRESYQRLNYEEGEAIWQNSWTVFYWAWWISWSPFVGLFIARVSRGRTVREFVLGVLIVPALITFLWITAFGGSALFFEISGGVDLFTEIKKNVATALFVLLEELPFTFAASMLGILLVTSFFVTSSDSGSLVIDSITAGGKLDAPVGQRIFWALSEGGVAAVLLLGGGLQALQTAAITTGLPFAFVLLGMVFSLKKGLDIAHKELKKRQQVAQAKRIAESNLES